MTDDASTSPGTALPPTRRPILPWLLAGALATAVVATVAVVWLALPGSHRARSPVASTPSAQHTREAITLRGSMELGGVAGNIPLGEQCWGHDGYKDMTEGAQVTVTDRGGVVLAIGTLQAGIVDPHPTLGDLAHICTFVFVVEGIPPGSGPYGLEVSHRGVIHYDESELAEPVTVTLGM